MSDDVLRPFPKPLKQRLWKTVTEYFAMLVLQHCFPSQYSTLEKGESPDLQSPDHRVGVEVTLAVSQREAQLDSQYYRAHTNPDTDTPPLGLLQLPGEVEREMASTSHTDPISALAQEKLIWQNALRKKMKKLPYYQTRGFQQLHLFVVYEEPPIPVPQSVWKEWVEEVLADYQDCYEIIYICYLCGLLMYEADPQTLQIIHLDRRDICQLKCQARRMVEQLDTQQAEKGVSLHSSG